MTAEELDAKEYAMNQRTWLEEIPTGDINEAYVVVLLGKRTGLHKRVGIIARDQVGDWMAVPHSRRPTSKIFKTKNEAIKYLVK